MRVALDTNRLTDLFSGDRAVIKIVERADEVWIPYVVLGEIRAGFAGGSTYAEKNEALLIALLNQSNVYEQYPDSETTRVFARLFVQLKRAGSPIPDNDLWIAALTIQHNLTLVTRDRHFQRIPQLILA